MTGPRAVPRYLWPADHQRTHEPIGHRYPPEETLNPRWRLWLLSRGLDPNTFKARDNEGGLIYFGSLPCTYVFSEWIQQQWRDWAASLGFTSSKNGSYPHELALANGHTHEDFDAWLAERGKEET